MGLVPPKGSHLFNSTNHKSTEQKLLNEKSRNIETNLLLSSDDDEVTICSRDDDSNLLIIDGNFKLENIVLDCYNVSHGIVIKKGDVVIKNCKFLGNGQSSIQEAIKCCGDSKLTIDHCFFENFATGINIANNVSLIMNQTLFLNCNTGLEITESGHAVFDQVEFLEANLCGIYYNALNLDPELIEKQIVFNDFSDFERLEKILRIIYK